MNLGLAAVAAAGVLLVSGCGSVPKIDGAPADLAVLEKKTSCGLRLCVTNTDDGFSGKIHDSFIAEMRPSFASVARSSDPSPEQCDLAITFDGIKDGFFAARSAGTGERLAHFELGFNRYSGPAVCAAFAEGTPLRAKLPARRPSPVSPSVAAPLAALGLPRSPQPGFASPERIDDLAVILGVESYSDIATKAPYAERDAEAFKAYVRALGVPERNIVLLTGPKAVRSSLTKNIEGWLPRMAKPSSRVYFYFSGHGAPDVKTGQAYLVPWDGDPNFLDATAYPVAKLYKKLGELPARQVLVAMDSCFSGAGGRSVLASGVRPLVGRIETGAVPAKVTVLAASGASEVSGSLDDKGHGAFTYFLLEGLNAGKTTPKELNDYLTPRVQDEARRLNRDQTPQLQGDGGWTLR